MSMGFSESVKIWKEGDTVILKKIEDLCRKNNISIAKLEKELNCPIVPISALKGKGLKEVCEKAVKKVADYFGKDVSYFLKE